MKNHARRGGCVLGLGISVALERHLIKHPINHANVEVHMWVQAGAEPVDEGDCANVQAALFDPPTCAAPGLFGLQDLRDDPQKNTQHHVQCRTVALHEVT